MGVIDAATAAQGEMKVEKRGKRNRPYAPDSRERLRLPYIKGFGTEGAVDGSILAGDFHLEDNVSLLPCGCAGVGEQSDETSLKSAEAAFDFALHQSRGLRFVRTVQNNISP